MLKNIINGSHSLWNHSFHAMRFKAMCSLAFFALLRIGEMTDSANNLAKDDVRLGGDSLSITFRKFKHSKGNPSVHTICAEKDRLLCPVSLMATYLSARGEQAGPLFIDDKGRSLSRKEFLSSLKSVLKLCKLPEDRVKSHSFRIGGATHMARTGASDTQIRLAGRWSSNAFLTYTRVHNC
jgi:site-specific recombinase XerD